MHYMYGSATVLQLLWTVVGLIGLIITVHLLLEAREDRRALARHASFQPGGVRDIVARANVRNMWARAIKLAVLVAIGIASMLAPAPIRYITLRAILQATGFCAVEVIIVWNAIADRRDRNDLFYVIRTQRFDALLAPKKENA